MAERLKIPRSDGGIGRRVRRNVHPDPVRRRGGRAGRRRRYRRPRLHRLGMGTRRRSRRLRRGQDQRRPHQPGGDRCAGRLPRLPLAQGRSRTRSRRRRRVRRRAARALELHRGAGQGSTPGTPSRPRASSPRCPATARCPCTSGARSATRSSAPRSCCSWSSRSPTRRNTAPAGQPRAGHRSACSSSRSAWPGAPTPDTRSTRPVTSARGSPSSSPDTARHCATSTGTSTSGCPSVGAAHRRRDRRRPLRLPDRRTSCRADEAARHPGGSLTSPSRRLGRAQ